MGVCVVVELHLEGQVDLAVVVVFFCTWRIAEIAERGRGNHVDCVGCYG